MAIEGMRDMPLAGLRYTGRRHRSVDNGRPHVADALVLHWSAGSKDVEALHRFFASRKKQASYNWAFDRRGVGAEYIPPEDAAWHAGDGLLPSAEQVLASGFVPVAEVPKPPPRYTNLRTASVCFCNRGFLTKDRALRLQRDGLPVVEARHRNPAMRRTLYEGFTEEGVDAFVATLPRIVDACPGLRVVTGHEDVTNSWIRGRGKFVGGSKTDPGPAWPWSRIPWTEFGLVVVRYDYEAHGWRAYPDVGASLDWNGPGALPRTVDPGP